MTPDDRLRAALRAAAGTAPAGDPDLRTRLLARAATRRRRRATGAGLAALLVVLAGVALAVPGNDDASRVETGPAERPTTTSTTAEAPPADDTPLAAPDAVAALEDSRIVVLSTEDGAIQRTLADVADPAGVHGITRTPDGTTVYFGVVHGDCTHELYAVPADGSGPAVNMAQGVLPTVSPDGTKLAYAGPSSPGMCPDALVVRDLATGAERRWLPPTDDGDRVSASITKIDWAPDSRTIVFAHHSEDVAAYLLDTTMEGRLDEKARPLRLMGQDRPTGHPAWRATDNRVAVVVDCCADLDAPRRPGPVLLVDVATGATEELLPPGIDPEWIDFDAGGHLLWVDSGGRLFVDRQGEGRRTRPLRRGVAAADW